MATSDINQVPVDIQDLICSKLWDTSPKSVLALSAVNFSWFHAAQPYLYRFLSVSINSQENLREVVTRLQESEVGKRYLRHARHLKLSGRMKFPVVSKEPGALDATGLTRLRPGTTFSLEEPLKPPFHEVFTRDGNLDTPEEHAKAWKPLVTILSQFRNLTHLVYNCSGRFAPGLVGAIQQQHPACKINLHNFRFKSLHDDLTDPDELELAMSPCLSRFSILSTWRDSNGVDDHNKEAAIRTISLAPNLKHVRILGCRPASSPMLHRRRNGLVKPWRGFNPPPKTFRKASLESLSFCGYYSTFDRVKLQVWNQAADLSMLRGLAFSVSDASVLPELMTYTRLPCLEELSILLQRNKTDEEFKPIVETFFRDLEPLTILDLSGTVHEELLRIIGDQHGSKLRKLTLLPYEDHYDMAGPPLRLQSSHLRMLADSCIHLSELSIRIKRTRGDEMETSCYEALGTFQNLETAQIYLDCSNSNNNNPQRVALETAMVNSAVDEALAKSIWDIICEGPAERRLGSLKIMSGGGSAFGNSHPGDLMTLVDNLSRGYLITKPSKGKQEDVTVVELTKERREDRDEQQRKHELRMLEKWGHKGLSGPSFTIFNQLWPCEESGKDWREVWRSWPLQRSK